MSIKTRTAMRDAERDRKRRLTLAVDKVPVPRGRIFICRRSTEDANTVNLNRRWPVLGALEVK